MSRRVFPALLLALALSLHATASHAQVLVTPGATWRYLDTGVDPGPDWALPSFDDSAWPSGSAQLGYGDGDEATVVSYGPDPNQKHITTWFRHAFTVADPSAFRSLLVRVLRDDGALVRLNGVEVFRTNLPAGPIAPGTRAITNQGGLNEDQFFVGAADCSLLVAGTNVLAVEVHQTYPTSSDVSFDLALEASTVPRHALWAWAGGVTATAARVKARILAEGPPVRIAVSEDPAFTAPSWHGPYTADPAANLVVTADLRGLRPRTRYHYAVERGGDLDMALAGTFETVSDGPFSFSLALGACARTGSNHAVFDTIRAHDPLFFLHMGDFHYQNISTDDIGLFRQAYEAVLTSPRQSALYRSRAVVYVWDDHDSGPNNGDSTSPARPAARAAFQENVPHHPLAFGTGDIPIAQAFSVGRVRFLVTDCRTERTPLTEPDGPAKTMLGAAQKAWLEQEMLAANGIYPVIVWVNSLPWIGAATSGEDFWAGYATERAEIADFIAANSIRGLLMLSGDAHMLAIDDGSNSDYSTTGGAAFPVFQAAALDQTGSVKGGPYSHGTFPGPGQFGLMTVLDDGGPEICVEWSGRNDAGAEILAWTACGIPAGTDTDSDGTPDADDCAFADADVHGAPGPVSGLRVGKVPGGSEVLLAWEGQDASAGAATAYDLVTGRISALRADRGFDRASCLAEDVPDPAWADPSGPPPAGDCDYYLVRAVNRCGSGGYGPAGPGGPPALADRDAPCAL